MKKNKSFTLIEVIVTIFIIILLALAFTPGLNRSIQRTELDRALKQLQDGIFETKSLAISPTRVGSSGKVMQAWIFILNITNSKKKYCYPVKNGNIPLCGFSGSTTSYSILPHSYVIFAAEDTNPNSTRIFIKQVSLPGNVSVFYDKPCHGDPQALCPSALAESYLWKTHFRNVDGNIGFGGRYSDNPDKIGDIVTSYWIPELWGNDCSQPKNCPQYSELVIVSGNIDNPESTFDTGSCNNGYYNNASYANLPCRKIKVDNVSGEIDVL